MILRVYGSKRQMRRRRRRWASGCWVCYEELGREHPECLKKVQLKKYRDWVKYERAAY